MSQEHGNQESAASAPISNAQPRSFDGGPDETRPSIPDGRRILAVSTAPWPSEDVGSGSRSTAGSSRRVHRGQHSGPDAGTPERKPAGSAGTSAGPTRSADRSKQRQAVSESRSLVKALVDIAPAVESGSGKQNKRTARLSVNSSVATPHSATSSNPWTHSDKPPWPADIWNVPEDVKAAPSPFKPVNGRSVTHLWATRGSQASSSRIYDTARLTIWSAVKAAERGTPPELLFTSSGPGERYALVPEPRSDVPLQWAHCGPGTIPNVVADVPRALLNPTALLSLLNTILGTTFTLRRSGMRQCLTFLLRVGRDLGEMYGFVRRFWLSEHPDFSMFPSIFFRRFQDDRNMREQASREHYITNSSISPRRVWDLYSNRVLPYHALPPHPSTHIPHNVWTVSHSWLDEADRAEVWTTINGRAWPVPLPRGTSLDHIRVELLNMGAEYVWLDVLCLRQRGRPADEATRADEWKLDIPTIGYTYSLTNVPCVTYFNGLGLPFDFSSTVLKSKRHWRNRVWTLQETTKSWLPGGATGVVSAAATTFFDHHWRSTLSFGDVWGLIRAVAELQRRHCDKELDRVSALAYLVRCATLPVYREQQPLEEAWAILIKHLPADIRGLIFLRYVEEHPSQLTLWPSWAQFLKLDVSLEPKAWVRRGAEPMYLVHDALLETANEGQYYQRLHSFGVCRIEELASVDAGGSRRFSIRPRSEGSRSRAIGIVGGRISAGGEYLFLRLMDSVWLAVRRVGSGNVRGDRALEVIKEGCIIFYSPPLLLPCRNVVVMYRDASASVKD